MTNTNVRDLTVGDTRKLILAFFVPMLITNMLQQVYNFADAFIVGEGLGDDCLAAVGNMGSLFFLIIGFSMGLANGFTILIGQSYGAKDFKLLKKNLAATIQLAAILAVVLTTASIIFLPDALRILRTDSIIMADSLKYGYIIFGGLSASILYNICAFTLRSLGDSKTPLYAIVISSVLNLLLDSFFIFILHTGVEGAAFATVMSQIVSSLVCIRKLKKIDFIHLSKEDFKVDLSRWGSLLKNGLPMAFMNSITATGCMVLQMFVNGFGVAFTSAYSVCCRYINLFMNPACTAGQAMSAFAGQNYGAKKYTRIREGLRVCLAISLVSYVIFGSIMFFGARYLGDVILDGSYAISLVGRYLPITGATLIFVDFLFVYRGAVQGMGFPIIPMFSGIAEMVLRICTAVMFIDRFGFRAVAMAEVSAWLGALLINIAAYYGLLPLKKTVISANQIKKILL